MRVAPMSWIGSDSPSRAAHLECPVGEEYRSHIASVVARISVALAASCSEGGTLHLMGGQVTERDEEDAAIYVVVINREEQYSIWPSHKEMPRGWRAVGKEGRKAECLHYIDQVWTDMRPLSLRQEMGTDTISTSE